MLITLLYTSSAATPRGAIDDLEILREAYEFNRNAGVTGYLARAGNHFAQVLEGEEATVRELFRRIRRDERHDNVQLLIEGPLEERRFADWSMGYRDFADMRPDENSAETWMDLLSHAADQDRAKRERRPSELAGAFRG